MMHSSTRSILQMVAVTLALLLVPLGMISLLALEANQRYLLPELERKAATVGQSLALRFAQALDFGIPLGALVGVDEFLRPVVEGAPDISYIALTDTEGRVLYASGLPVASAQELLSGRDGAAADGALLARISGALQGVVAWFAPGDEAVSASVARRLGDYFDTAVPVRHGDAPIATLHVGVPQAFIQGQVEEILFDIFILLLVGVLIAFELVALVVGQNLRTPLGAARQLLGDLRGGRFTRTIKVPVTGNEVGRFVEVLNEAVERVNREYANLRDAASRVRVPDAAAIQAAALAPLHRRYAFAADGKPTVERESGLIVVRVLAFLFVFAEELARPFLPVYIDRLVPAAPFLEPALLVGIPISAFMLVAALTMAFGGVWSDRIGRRPAFVTGALLSTAGLAGTAFAQGFADLLLWRLLSGVGYGLTFVACQGYVIDRTSPDNRARGVSMFVGGILAADICGPAIGGILADRIGFQATFLIGAGTAALAALLVYRLMEPRPPERPADGQRSPFAGLGALAHNWRFSALILLAAVPPKMMLTGFLFYLVPLYLTALDSSQSEIGRVAMTYGIAAVVLTPLFAALADRWRAHGVMVGLGGLVAGMGMLPILFAETPERVVLGVVCLGIGQAMSISALLVVVMRVGQSQIERLGQAPVLGAFRLFERLGAASGPFVVAGFITEFGFAGAMAATGVVGIATAVLFSTLFMIVGLEPEESFADQAAPGAQQVQP